jgi:hypothetical protein
MIAMLKYFCVLALVLANSATVAMEDDCSAVLALSRIKSGVTRSKNEIASAASDFCKAYSESKAAGKTISVGASYDLLAASFSSGSVSSDAIASRYCSASSNYSQYNDDYSSYIDAIAPGAMEAYKACVDQQQSGLHFRTGSVSSKEFAMFVVFDRPGDSTVTVSVKPSTGVTCEWGASPTTNAAQSLKSPSSKQLTCQRPDENVPSFVGLTSDPGTDTFLFPWPKYDKDGVPVDTITTLQHDLDSSLQALKTDTAKALKSIVTTSSENSCPFPDDIQRECTATCNEGLAIGGSCEIYNPDNNVYTLTSVQKSGPNWTCHYFEGHFPGHVPHPSVAVIAKATCFVPPH